MEASWTFPSHTAFSDHLIKQCHRTVEQDMDMRKKNIPILLSVCHILQLPPPATFTAIILFHRFLLVFPIDHDENVKVTDLIILAVLVASKAEEAPRRLSHIITAGSQHFSVTCNEHDRLLLLEPLVMARSGFDFCVDSPLRWVWRVKNRWGDEVCKLGQSMAEQALQSQAVCLYGSRALAGACLLKACSLLEITADNVDWRCPQEAVNNCLEYIRKLS